MRIYIASYFNTRARLFPWRDKVKELGHTVTSSWLREHRDAPDHTTQTSDYTDAELRGFALRDFDELSDSDLIIVDTFDVTPRGGREVEMGYIFGSNKKVWVVGPKRNVFHQLAHRHFEHWGEVVNALHPRV